MAAEPTITEGASSAPEQATTGPIFAALESQPSQPAPKATPDGAQEGADTRYDKDPEFKKRIDSLRDRERRFDEATKQFEALKSSQEQTVKQLMDKIVALEKGLVPKPEGPRQFKKLNRDEFMRKFDQEPADAITEALDHMFNEFSALVPKTDEEALFGKFLNRLADMGRQAESKTTKEKAAKTINDFAAKHEDFEGMIPKIQQFISENPGHNAISAYHELKGTTPDIQKQIDEAVEAERKKFLKEGANTPTPIKPGGGSQRGQTTEPKRKPGESTDSWIARKLKLK